MLGPGKNCVHQENGDQPGQSHVRDQHVVVAVLHPRADALRAVVELVVASQVAVGQVVVVADEEQHRCHAAQRRHQAEDAVDAAVEVVAPDEAEGGEEGEEGEEDGCYEEEELTVGLIHPFLSCEVIYKFTKVLG